MVIDRIVVLISLLKEKTFVAVGIVASVGGRGASVGSISLLFAVSLRNGHLGVLVEAPEGNREDFVVQERAEDKEDKAENCLPVERLKSEKTTHDPDDKSPTSVDSSSLRS